jgi:signal transduction histidine kinase
VLHLQILQGPDRGTTFQLPANEPQLIGRSSEALPLTDSTVSRRHAELTPDHGDWYIRDLASANGTYLNGHQIADRERLSPGDQIKCGSTLFVYMPSAEERRDDTVQLLDPESFDVTVEHTVNANEESMVLGAADPVRATRDHLRVIYELTALTAGTSDRSEMLERVMDLIFDEFQPERGFILHQSGPDQRSEPVVVRYRQRPKTQDEGRIPVSRTIITHTLERREGVLSTNAMNDDRFQSGDSVRDYGIRSAICVPIQSVGAVWGVIHIDSSLAHFTFTESQLQLLTAIGQLTGVFLLGVERVRKRVQTERLAAMGETVASLSHAIKNILQGLRGGADAVELAINRGDLELAGEGWPILARNLDRIYSLTLNMLTYSKPARLEIELTTIPPLIAEVVQLLAPQCERKGIAVLQDLDDGMPPIPIDPDAMHQALMNLLTNAVEALPKRGGAITISTSYDSAAHEARIVVSDNGPGIPADQRSRVFEAFASSKGQRGTGLGLAVTRKTIEEHGGRITLEPEDDQAPGRGASFAIVLPVDNAASSAHDTKLPRPSSSPSDPFAR